MTMLQSIRTLLLAAFLSATSVSSAAAATLPNAPASYVMTLGKLKVVALYDGYLPGNMTEILRGGDTERVATLLENANLDHDARMSVNAYLIDTGKQKILVDTGGGALTGPTAGRLQESLGSAGYSADGIDVILMTHLHPDHIGGLVNGEQARFRKAVVWINEVELNYWKSYEADAQRDADAKAAAKVVRRYLKPYEDDGRIAAFNWGDKLAANVEAVDLKGHTPGHTGFRVGLGAEQIQIWGDVIHVEPVQFPEPEVTVIYDASPKQAVRTRLSALADAVQGGYWVADAHIAFPGIGKVGKHGDHYIWVPVDQ
ncbi:MBL fold metallo-hydrolase [uncultured Stenotrophomonas sp.]|uniref:MBL fold metallo-hydrolase n=1 Tax=uncultured Stenotrophomonas sp. TaxID=165438 RepID=UPI0025D90649|nr:MBL fold metallo-hydrolase [uncultured Stenotrophomonas sp.]